MLWWFLHIHFAFVLHIECQNPLLTFLLKGLHARILRSTAAASAMKMAASSTHVTCRIASWTSGLLCFPSPWILQLMTKPPTNGLSAPKSPLLCGLGIGLAAVVAVLRCFSVSMKNSPPFSAFMWISDMRNSPPSWASHSRWNLQQTVSLMPRSRHASSFPHGCQLSDLPVSGRTINQDPGLDLATQSQPEDGTKGVVMKAAATAEPERSCMVTFHPFLSLLSVSKLVISVVEPDQYALKGSIWETLSFHNYQKFY